MSNQFVIAGLTSKRSELAGEIGEAEKRIGRLRAELDALDTTLRLFDPTIAPRKIKPRVKRTAVQRFRSGELTCATLAVMRKAEQPLSVREIAALVAEQCGMDMSTTQAANVVVANIRAVLARPHDGLVSEKRGREPMVYRVGS